MIDYNKFKSHINKIRKRTSVARGGTPYLIVGVETKSHKDQ
jgi:hypothetical protein